LAASVTVCAPTPRLAQRALEGRVDERRDHLPRQLFRVSRPAIGRGPRDAEVGGQFLDTQSFARQEAVVDGLDRKGVGQPPDARRDLFDCRAQHRAGHLARDRGERVAQPIGRGVEKHQPDRVGAVFGGHREALAGVQDQQGPAPKRSAQLAGAQFAGRTRMLDQDGRLRVAALGQRPRYINEM